MDDPSLRSGTSSDSFRSSLLGEFLRLALLSALEVEDFDSEHNRAECWICLSLRAGQLEPEANPNL